ncbi:DUF6646 family protein [Flavobacterium psychrotolerans]|uniref:Outer membrane protein beta-barrel domain-containing protein n=1 Tax=Flavobacterium psychrotolerans TaxID=2169410 RepID=A0A2U1JP31_9FLAO|nr:DUF6646 family protein [Flavobacterium psychrotolerans]PWA06892.1 hypothetical protein DB895_02615 [Flavobacterium psychrotolerans]
MKKIITLLFVVSAGFVNAQAYKGNGDIKGQVGANFQDGATGIHTSVDFGLGENMSYGFTGTYLLSVQENILGEKPKFGDRIDVKVRFNANLGNVLKLDPKMDIYPGLDLGLKNFGGHLGFRYFFTEGFGVFTEAGIPIAKYDTHLTGFDHYNNQFIVNAGVSFNL